MLVATGPKVNHLQATYSDVVNDKIKASTLQVNAWTFNTKAKASTLQAKTFDTKAKASTLKAKTFDNKAKTFDTKAKTFDNKAKALTLNAKTFDTKAKASTLKAKTFDTKAKASTLKAKTFDTKAKALTLKAFDTKAKATTLKAKASTVKAKAWTGYRSLCQGLYAYSQSRNEDMQYVWQDMQYTKFDCFCLDIHLLLITYKLLLIYYYNYYVGMLIRGYLDTRVPCGLPGSRPGFRETSDLPSYRYRLHQSTDCPCGHIQASTALAAAENAERPVC